MSASGTVAGWAVSADRMWHAFTYQGGTMRDLGTLGGPISMALGINEAGEVVGYSLTNPGDLSTRHAFPYADGKMTDLNTLLPKDLGLTLTSADAINHAGQILASAGGSYYLLTPSDLPVPPVSTGDPVPIPEPTVLAISGLLAVAAVARRAAGGRRRRGID